MNPPEVDPSGKKGVRVAEVAGEEEEVEEVEEKVAEHRGKLRLPV